MKVSAKVKGDTSFDNVIKQVRFATAQALTFTARDGQKAIVESLGQTFTLRGNWYRQENRFGIKVQMATKQNLNAKITTMADWLDLHETGGTKVPRGNDIAIPTVDVRRNKRNIIQKSQRPRNLRKAFVMNTRFGKALAQRKGRGKKSELKFLYWFEPVVKIPKNSTFYEPAYEAIDKNFDKNFDKSLENAFKTAKI